MVVGDTEILFGGRGGHIQVHGHTVSRRHARILRADGGLWIEDLGGGAGVQVNGQPVERAELHNGDRIEVGDTLLTIWAE
jgi:pSer/pThr/pTyr-binding forkhead associated (FHA) protein